MDSVIHFEMPFEDKKRVREFYESVFGWNMKQLGEDMENYILAGTAELDENMMPKKPGTINGGFYQKGKNTGTHIVISVENLKKSIEMVNKSGGKVLGQPILIPGIGNFIMFTDSEGNRVGMLEPPKEMKK